MKEQLDFNKKAPSTHLQVLLYEKVGHRDTELVVRNFLRLLNWNQQLRGTRRRTLYQFLWVPTLGFYACVIVMSDLEHLADGSGVGPVSTALLILPSLRH